MRNAIIGLVMFFAGAAACYYVTQNVRIVPRVLPKVLPRPPVVPRPAPRPAPTPPRKPWGDEASARSGAKVGGFTSPDGAEYVQCDLPAPRHVKNRGGSDGYGLCVFASMRHSGDWASDPALYAVFEYMFDFPGGGYPDKVDAVLERMCREKGYAKPDYFHVQANDLEVLKLACANRLMPGVTYYYSPTGRYNGQRISHMVSLPHATDNWFAVLDNNYPGAFEWMKPGEFTPVFSGGRTGWAFIPLTKSPPPAPRNRKA